MALYCHYYWVFYILKKGGMIGRILLNQLYIIERENNMKRGVIDEKKKAKTVS
jgi:hypothetical protein